MKKWFVGLMLLALVLLVSGAAMGEKETVFYCFMCREERNCTISDTYEYSDSVYHVQRITCKTCGYRGMAVGSFHTESIAATCQSPAYCDVCKSYYGDSAEHNWSEWLPNLPWLPNLNYSNLHYRYCMNIGCSASESEPHEGNANCVTSAMCSKCNATYTDTTNHAGPLTYSYEKTNETFHKRIETCTACGKETGNVVLTRHEESVPANCTTSAYCAVCKSNYGDPDPNNHVGETITTYVKTSETQHTAKITYAECKHTVDGESTDHTETTAATCTAAAYCAVCKSSYGAPDPDAHDLVHHDAQAPTCTKVGWDAYDTCQREGCTYSTYAEILALTHDLVHHDAQAPTCFDVGWDAYDTCQREGCDYTTYTELPRLVHWYSEWTPNADGTHLASCRQGCRYDGTVSCTFFTYQLLNGDQATEFTLCPVCGEVSDGTRLVLAEAAAQAVTGKLPAGEVVVRVGTLESGEAVLSVAFEIGGRLTQPAGQVKITLPAELLAGYTLSLLSEDGAEAELTFDVQEASFVLDFDANPSPVRVIRLVPAA